MMRSLYSGVAGLKTHQVKMDVIGNNIANVNTVAYKSQSITFAELMYQTTQSASGPNAETGRAGVNAKQIGLGVQSAAISTAISTQGSSQNTGNAFDLRISGDAFFIVNGGGGNKFTRDGSFYVDAAGNLAMSSNGYNVMGWQVDKNGDIVQDNVSALKILAPENMTSEPQVTSRANMSGIIDKMDPQVLGDGKIINLQFYDNLGYNYTARYTVKDTDYEGQYALTLEDVRDANNDSILEKYNANIFTGSSFDPNGAPTPVVRSKTYTLSDKYSVSADMTITPTSGTALKPPFTGDQLTVKDGETLSDADKYAQQWGVSDYATMQKLIFPKYETTTPSTDNPSSENLYVKDADGNYALTTDSKVVAGTTYYKMTPKTFDELLADTALLAEVLNPTKKTLQSCGYMAPNGKALTLQYDKATGSLKSVGGSAENFFLLIEPKKSGDENPFSMKYAQGDDVDFPGIKVFMNDTSNVNNEKKSTIGAISGDHDGYGTGWALGTMTGVSIQNDGKIYGAYDNGQTKLLGQIAFAKFANASGLEKEGDNLYSATLNSGEFDGIGVDVSSDGGKVSSGILEMSNVDLSSEFTELITTQRGFQANSRIITVSDTLLEELVNLKR
ncbi:MAG: flagellar hook-basal body complex protein [Lachnospiraceae bacterium]|nr:flagellar hook-basal body complex protein [Lachnospiraceae bacterium]